MTGRPTDRYGNPIAIAPAPARSPCAGSAKRRPAPGVGTSGVAWGATEDPPEISMEIGGGSRSLKRHLPIEAATSPLSAQAWHSRSASSRRVVASDVVGESRHLQFRFSPCSPRIRRMRFQKDSREIITSSGVALGRYSNSANRNDFRQYSSEGSLTNERSSTLSLEGSPSVLYVVSSFDRASVPRLRDTLNAADQN